jgi:hypothetical protein
MPRDKQRVNALNGYMKRTDTRYWIDTYKIYPCIVRHIFREAYDLGKYAGQMRMIGKEQKNETD